MSPFPTSEADIPSADLPDRVQRTRPGTWTSLEPTLAGTISVLAQGMLETSLELVPGFSTEPGRV